MQFQTGLSAGLKLLKQLLLLFSKFGRRIDNQGHNVGAAACTAQVWHAMIRQFEIGAGLRAGRNFHGHWPVYSSNFDLGTESGFYHTYVLIAEY